MVEKCISGKKNPLLDKADLNALYSTELKRTKNAGNSFRLSLLLNKIKITQALEKI